MRNLGVTIFFILTLLSSSLWGTPKCFDLKEANERADALEVNQSLYRQYREIFESQGFQSAEDAFFRRIRQKTPIPLVESLAFVDYMAQSNFFAWTIDKIGTVLVKKVWSRPYLRLSSRIRFFELGWHKDIGSSVANESRQAIYLRFKYPENREGFYQAMQVMALHFQSLALLSWKRSNQQPANFLKRAWSFFIPQGKQGKLEEMARIRIASRKLRDFFSGLQGKTGVAVIKESRFSVESQKWWILLIETIPRVLFPYYKLSEKLPVGQQAIDRFLSDTYQKETLSLRMSSDSVLRKYRYSLLLSLTGLYIWTLVDLGVTFLDAQERAALEELAEKTEFEELYQTEKTHDWDLSIVYLNSVVRTAQAQRYQFLLANGDILTPMEVAELRRLKQAVETTGQ